MRAAVANYMTMPVPRYTSYPTAPHFHEGIGEGAVRAWLARLDPAEPISLYVHVPFCRQVCWYCGCNMKLVGNREGPLDDYVDALVEEIGLVADALPGRLRVSHVHFGGGTPTVLSAAALGRVMSALGARFDLLPDAEVAIECDPRTFAADKAQALGALGFNRASFGVQEFDPKVQAAINRIQPPEMVARAVEALRAAGIASVNFDLIYGLPHQTAAMLLDTVARCLAFEPSRIALFGYAHVPWVARRQKMIDGAALPGAAERLEQAGRAAAALEAGGMVPVGMDHFAAPDDALARAAATGRLRRNFQGYTTDGATTLIGFGATSIGRTPSGYMQNIAETGAWARAVREGRFATAKGVALTEGDNVRGAAIEELMCFGATDTRALARQFGVGTGWAREAAEFLRPLEADGLVSIDEGRIAVTAEGRPLVRVVASAFDAYIARQDGRHSVAV